MKKDLRQQASGDETTIQEGKKDVRDLSLREAQNNLQRVSLQGSEGLEGSTEIRSGKTSGRRLLDNSDDIADTNRNLAEPEGSGDGGGGGGGINANTLTVTICVNGQPEDVDIYVA